MLTKEDLRYQRVHEHLLMSAEVKHQVATTCSDAILDAADLVAESFRLGCKLLICGNGGSAADSQHLAAEFVSRLTMDFDRPGLPAIALTTDSSFLTAYANDFDFNGIFARQVQALGEAGDVLIGISTSGNSGNIIRAVTAAKEKVMHTIVLTGEGGLLSDLADVAICVPSSETQYIQEAHLAIEHILCGLVERMIF